MPERVRVQGDLFHGRVPDGAVYVGRAARGLRSSPYANPFRVGSLVQDPESDRFPPLPYHGKRADDTERVGRLGGERYIYHVREVRDNADAVALFINWAARARESYGGLTYAGMARRDLAGRDLACWCGPLEPCHADALLRMAAGLRPVTPEVGQPGGGRRIKVQRCCNGCGLSLGDVTGEEIACAIDGRALPDVRGECPDCGEGRP